MAMEVQIPNSVSLSTEPSSAGKKKFVLDKQSLEQFIAEGSLDFDEWTTLISDIENSCSDDLEMICLVYDSFLAEYPLCYGYWRKYADHKAQLCTIDKVVEVFERAVQSATYSVDMWFHYVSFGMSTFEDPHAVRRLFKRGLSFVGKDYLCHTLWDKYIEFELSQQQWSSLALIYVQTLRFPSRKLHHYYASFKTLAAAWKEDFERQSDFDVEFQPELVLEGEVPVYYKVDEICSVIKDLLDPSIGVVRSKVLQKYLFVGEQIYKEASQLDKKINCFENHIQRSFFHVKPLDDSQLKNWHEYLNFAEKQGDFDWVVKLYERCLISCANYPEFWMRYVDFMESKGGREIASYALERATQIFLKKLPMIHLFSARYKEQIGDTPAARAAFLESDTDSDSRFIENVTVKANMEKRMGDFAAACNIYKEAMETAVEQKKLHALPLLYVNFSQLTYMTTDNADAARDVLIDGIKRVPLSKLLLEELIKFTMLHGGSRHINIVDAVVSNAVYSGPDVLQAFSMEDAENLSSLYLQFLDLCGTIHDVRNAWNRHFKSFPHTVRTANECPARKTKSLRTFILGRWEKNVASPPQLSESEQLMHSSSGNKNLSPPKNNDMDSDYAITSLPENHDFQPDGAEANILDKGVADSSWHERMQQLPNEATEQQVRDVCNPEVLSFNLADQVANEDVIALYGPSKEDNAQQECEDQSKLDPRPLSLDALSLDPGENDSPGSLYADSHECEAPQEINISLENTLKREAQHNTSLPDGTTLGDDQNTIGSHLTSSSMGTQASSSAPIQNGIVSPSSSTIHQNFIPEAHSLPRTLAYSGRNWHQKHNPDGVQQDFRFGFRGHSHKRQHRQRRFSSQEYPQTENVDQKPVNLGYPSQPLFSPNAQAQQAYQAQSQFLASTSLTAHTWPMQNMQHENFASASQSEVPAQPAFYSQAMISQYPAQNSEQNRHLQDNPANYQMWQHYYYYQQQQQLLQLQHLQPLQQQQLLQQHYYQQQHHFPQQQEPIIQQQQPQLQQQFLPQQQQQQHLLSLPQQPQYQLQEQVQLQDQQPPQQQWQELRQSEQQISMSEIEKCNNNCSKQDQVVAPSNSTVAFTRTPSASPS